MYRKLTYAFVLGLALSLVVSGAVFGRTLNIRISAGGNDAEQHIGNGSMDIPSTDLEFPYEDAGNPATDRQITALRFLAVPAPKGATVTKAYVEFEVDAVDKNGSANPVNVLIQGELTPNAAAIQTTTRHLEGRTARTAAKVQWSVPAWTKVNDKYQSPDISAVIQEILNQDGWGPGNALMLFVVDDPANPSVGLREAESFEGEAAAAPLLFIEVFIPQAMEPVPVNGALEVTSPLLQWTAGDLAVMHKVYISTNPELTEADLASTAPPAMYYHLAGLTPGTTYYWRVDEVEADGVTVHPGQVWSFTTMPLTAHFPSPYDGALWRKTNLTVSWTAGQDAVSHKVYGGTDKAAVTAGDPDALLATVAEPKLDASALLQPMTTYFWRVDEVDSTGAVHAGPVWTFSTIDPAGGAVAEYWDNMTLAGDPKVIKIEPEINFDWGLATVPGVNSPDVNIPVDKFSCRWTAALNVPVTGKYRLYDATDDGGRLFLNGVQIAGNWVDRGTTEDTSAEFDFVAGQRYALVMEMYENGGGAAAYLRWSGPGIPKEIIPQGALQLVTWATGPEPKIGAEGIGDMPLLSWNAGVGAVEYDIYLNTDEALVTKGDAKAKVARQTETSYVPAALKWNTTYYWRIDAVAADGTVVAGDVWSFKVADYIPVIDSAVTINYNNTTDPFITELIQEYAGPQDWTKNGVTSLQLELKGNAPKLTVNGGTVTLMGAGVDIWGNADQFRYAFKTLTGDGSMIARVADRGMGSNEWAKGGVMIRQSIAAGSSHAFMPITAGGGNGASFQRRVVADKASSNSDSGTAVAPPYWVKIDRVGAAFTGSISPDGVAWTQLGDPITIEMADPVLIGLAVTSHAAGELRTFKFDSIATTGNITGNWTVADIGIAQGGNDPAPVYVALEDSAGKKAVVKHPANPNVTVSADWMSWKILTSSFSGVNLKAITKVIVGVGDGKPDGTGSIQVANAKVVKPITIAVVNPSFEQPNAAAPSTKLLFAPPAIRYSSVPGWSTDKEPAASFITKKASPSDGAWAALLAGGDPSIWQVTGHTVVEGEAFQLDVDSAVVMGAVKDVVGNLQISLFYQNDAGKRVTLGSKSFAMPVTVKGYSLSISGSEARAAAGRKLGIEIANIRDNIIGVDNVRLKTK